MFEDILTWPTDEDDDSGAIIDDTWWCTA